jgi:hypothetical protein
MLGKPDGSRPPPASILDLGSQLEDLFVHVLKCEDWADLDDRIDLAVSSWERTRPRRRPGPPLLGEKNKQEGGGETTEGG